MKLHRTLAALVVATALSIGSVVPAASAVVVAQPLTLVGPTLGQKLTTFYPEFSWVAPVDVAETEIVVSSAKKTDAGGRLPADDKNYVMGETQFDARASFSDKSRALSVGTYYWQVWAKDAAGAEFLSPVQKFAVPLIFDISKAKAKIGKMEYNGQRAIFGNATVQCNFPEEQYYTQFVMEVWKGKKKLTTSSQARGDCAYGYPVKAEAVWAPGNLKSGTKLTIKMYVKTTHNSTVKWGGLKAKKQKGEVASTTLTWKR